MKRYRGSGVIMNGISVRPKCDVYIDLLCTVGRTIWARILYLFLKSSCNHAHTRLMRMGTRTSFRVHKQSYCKPCWPRCLPVARGQAAFGVVGRLNSVHPPSLAPSLMPSP